MVVFATSLRLELPVVDHRWSLGHSTGAWPLATKLLGFEITEPEQNYFLNHDKTCFTTSSLLHHEDSRY